MGLRGQLALNHASHAAMLGGLILCIKSMVLQVGFYTNGSHLSAKNNRGKYNETDDQSKDTRHKIKNTSACTSLFCMVTA
jgi:hypothetical protein